MHIYPIAKLPIRQRRFLALVFLVSALAQACSDDLECPAGTRQAGSACQRVHEVEEGMDDAAVLPAADAGADPGADAGSDAGRDAGQAPVPCYLDRDHDGAGSGEPVACAGASDDAGADADAMAPETAADAAAADLDGGASLPPDVVTRGGDCDDGDPLRAPTLAESCDGIDNDCDASVDEDSKNVCGGTCIAPFEHELGESCSNGLLGTCAREGVYTCQGDVSLVCTTPEAHAGNEVCGDKLDNDCDGQTDEADAVNVTTWYKDCDEDGYAASSAGALRSCVRPLDVGACTWTFVTPHQATKTDWDCDDSKAEYWPGADYGFPPSGASSWDLNCDGVKAPAASQPAACSSSFVSHLNADANYCDASAAGIGCLVWKDGSGQYRTTPQAKCPDAAAYRVSGQRIILPGGSFWSCSQVAKPASWPCR